VSGTDDASGRSAAPQSPQTGAAAMQFDLTETPAPADLEALSRNLGAFNDADAGPGGRRPLAVFLRDADGRLAAGLSGYTAWGWLYTQWLWVDDAWRGQGIAQQLLARAEVEAIARGCHGAWIDTFNPVALKSYRRAGYEVFGELPEFPRGRARSFLSKALVVS
jgi:GNAT superfamily N-acetyltransferase